MGIVSLCKLQNGEGFSALSAAFDDQRLLVWCVFPLCQPLFDFSFQHHISPLAVSINAVNNFFKGLLKKRSTFSYDFRQQVTTFSYDFRQHIATFPSDDDPLPIFFHSVRKSQCLYGMLPTLLPLTKEYRTVWQKPSGIANLCGRLLESCWYGIAAWSSTRKTAFYVPPRFELTEKSGRTFNDEKWTKSAKLQI